MFAFDELLLNIIGIIICFVIGVLLLIVGVVLAIVGCCIKIDKREIRKPLKYSMLISVLLGLIFCIFPVLVIGTSDLEPTDYLYYLIAEEHYHIVADSDGYYVMYKGVKYVTCQYLFNQGELKPEDIRLAVVEDDYVTVFSERVAADGTVLLLEDGSGVLVPEDKDEALLEYYINNCELNLSVRAEDGYNYFNVNCNDPAYYAKELLNYSGSEYVIVPYDNNNESYLLFFYSNTDGLQFDYSMLVFVCDGKLALDQGNDDTGFKCTILPDELSDKLLPMLREAVG